MRRSSGILLPLFALPSPQGIGSFGEAAYRFVDFLAQAGQSWWQILPLGTVDDCGSPYQGRSAFAVEPLYLDMERLRAQGFLRAREWEQATPIQTDTVPYADLFRRLPLLQKVGERCYAADGAAVEAFAASHPWCVPYALFTVLEQKFSAPWTAWEEPLRTCDRAAITSCRERFAREIGGVCALQYLAFSQWRDLKTYANGKGVLILGDLPMYVAHESADVWSGQSEFQLDAHGESTAVSGVPPDAFCAGGQRWGHPLYDWAELTRGGCERWLARVAWMGELYDGVRLDHFRAFDRFWAISPEGGRWEKGGGLPLLQAFRAQCPDLFFVAEDLGFLDHSVHELRRKSGFYGMEVLQFAFEQGSIYLPHRHTRESVCCTGTHDHPSLAAWCKDPETKRERAFARRYLGATRADLPKRILRAGMASVSDLFFAQMQDYIGSCARTNTPGTRTGNWQWRLSEDALSDSLARAIREMTELYGRI